MAENNHSSHGDCQLSSNFFKDDDFFEIHYEEEDFQRLMKNYTFVLRYTGSRLYGQINPPDVDVGQRAMSKNKEYHSFWDMAFSGVGIDDKSALIISDPTIDNSPVGIEA